MRIVKKITYFTDIELVWIYTVYVGYSFHASILFNVQEKNLIIPLNLAEKIIKNIHHKVYLYEMCQVSSVIHSNGYFSMTKKKAMADWCVEQPMFTTKYLLNIVRPTYVFHFGLLVVNSPPPLISNIYLGTLSPKWWPK